MCTHMIMWGSYEYGANIPVATQAALNASDGFGDVSSTGQGLLVTLMQ